MMQIFGNESVEVNELGITTGGHVFDHWLE